MPPQQTYSPDAQLPPVTGQVVIPPVQPPQKSRRPLIIIILVVLVIVGAAGFAAYTFLQPAKKNNPVATDNKHVGSYPYINACNAFTAGDFESASGTKSNKSLIQAEFADEIDTKNPTRAYTSTCSRYELPGANAPVNDLLSVDVTIHQYPDTDRTQAQMFIFGLDKATTDPELGGLANFEKPVLTFQKSNTVIDVTIQGYGTMSSSQIQTLAKAVAKKVSDRIAGNADLATLNYPSDLAGEGYTYQNACSLWGLDDFNSQFSNVDKAFVKMVYAEALVPEAQQPSDATESAHTNCTLGTRETGGAFAYVDAYYYPNTAKAQSGYDSYLNKVDDIALTGLGDKAVLKAYSASDQQYEKVMVLRGTTMYMVQFIPENVATRGNAQVQTDVKAMAAKVLSRLK